MIPECAPASRTRAGHYSSTPILPQKDSYIDNPFPGVTQSRTFPAKRDLRHDPDSLLVVFFMVYDGECPIELFEEEKPAHLVGQGEAGQRQGFISSVQDRS